MKSRSLVKNMLRSVWKTKNRFLSIFAIIALGSGFFAGIKATCPDMKLTAEIYYRELHLMDFHLLSTMGFVENDIDAVRNAEGVDAVSAGYSYDFFLQNSDSTDNTIIKAHSLHDAMINDPNGVNQMVLKEGRFPQNDRECVVERNIHTPGSFRPGEKITLLSGDSSTETSDILEHNTFEIVGIVEWPMYISFERGHSKIGNGVVDAFILIPEKAFRLEAYTDLYLTLKKSPQLSPFSDAYDTLIEQQTAVLDALAEKRSDLRYEEIVSEARKPLDTGIEEYEAGLKTYQEQKSRFETEIKDAEAKLDEGAAEYQAKKLEYDQNLAKFKEAESAYLSTKPQTLQKLKAAEAQLSEQEASLSQAREQLEALRQINNMLEQTVAEVESHPAINNPPKPQANALLAALLSLSENGNAEIPISAEIFSILAQNEPWNAEQLQTLSQQSADLHAYIKTQDTQLISAQNAIAAGSAEIDNGYAELKKAETALEETKKQLSEGSAMLSAAKSELDKGRETLESEKEKGETLLRDAEAELQKAKKEIDDGEAKIASVTKPTWYIQDRSSNPGYSDFSIDADRVDAIAKVFPVFFILVAMLVCLTTMTRMVEEQRLQIGTLKALGYTDGAIISQYLIYAITASISGGITGLLIGFKLFPVIIFKAYKILYVMPPIQAIFRFDYAAICILTAILCTGFSALAACYHELRAQPAEQMRPRAPKSGKRIFLERLSFLWSHLNFTQKVTFRNLLRYKNRFFMTVVGIAGCTALMLTGFGVKYSISAIVEKQYGNIFTYDVIAMIDDKAAPDDLETLDTAFKNSPYLETGMYAMQQSVDFKIDGDEKNANLFIPHSSTQLAEFITLKKRVLGTPIALPENQIVITEKLAKMLKKHEGDKLTIPLNGMEVSLPIAAITENYTFHYVYMSPETYEKNFGSPPVYNTMLGNMTDSGKESQLSEELLKHQSVLGVTYASAGGQKFKDIVSRLDYIVVVLILAAGALAFVVLYNLTNINVNERIRELATIKVLGFYDKEVSAYIYRENTISTVIGIILGLAGGIFLDRFVVTTAEVDLVMFAPDIGFHCFVYAALLTLAFTLIVNVVLHFRLRKISMVESLKSVE